jgi:nitroreductase
MSIMDIIKKRRSIRSFEEREVDDEVLTKLIEAGVWAPSGGNAQTWVFIAVKDPQRIERIKAISPGMFGTPAALIVVCQDKKAAYEKGGELGRDTVSVMDAAMATQNILLEATARGLGSCPILSFHKGGLKRLLKLPEHIVPELIISLGYPAEAPKPPERKFAEVYFLEEYSGGK